MRPINSEVDRPCCKSEETELNLIYHMGPAVSQFIFLTIRRNTVSWRSESNGLLWKYPCGTDGRQQRPAEDNESVLPYRARHVFKTFSRFNPGSAICLIGNAKRALLQIIIAAYDEGLRRARTSGGDVFVLKFVIVLWSTKEFIQRRWKVPSQDLYSQLLVRVTWATKVWK